ncbi:hypothetical protein BDZ89DRAFT_1148092 [Hymenopellis radicata]|nr:hypothetical protein BDZ89DRAFT_1148092 [Hymenopellis radicata]
MMMRMWRRMRDVVENAGCGGRGDEHARRGDEHARHGDEDVQRGDEDVRRGPEDVRRGADDVPLPLSSSPPPPFPFPFSLPPPLPSVLASCMAECLRAIARGCSSRMNDFGFFPSTRTNEDTPTKAAAPASRHDDDEGDNDSQRGQRQQDDDSQHHNNDSNRGITVTTASADNDHGSQQRLGDKAQNDDAARRNRPGMTTAFSSPDYSSTPALDSRTTTSESSAPGLSPRGAPTTTNKRGRRRLIVLCAPYSVMWTTFSVSSNIVCYFVRLFHSLTTASVSADPLPSLSSGFFIGQYALITR